LYDLATLGKKIAKNEKTERDKLAALHNSHKRIATFNGNIARIEET